MGVKSAVTICLVPSLSNGPWIYRDDLEISIPKAKAAGFDAVEIFPSSAQSLNQDDLSTLLDENGMSLSAVGSGAGKLLRRLHLTSPDRKIREKARDFLGAIIDLGGRFGAAAIIGSMQGSVEKGVDRQRALEWLGEGLVELSQRSDSYGVKLIYEPLNRYETNLINRLSEGVNMLETYEIENVYLLADLFHMNIEEKSISGAIREAGDYVGYVHIADSNRRAAGMGHADLRGVAKALSDIGYDGYISAEALPYPDPDHAAAMTMAAFREIMIPAFQ